MARVVLTALVVCLLVLYALQTHAQTSSLQIEDEQRISYEILREKIFSLRELLLLFDCNIEYPLINARTYLKNASGALKDSLETSVDIAPLYMSVAEEYYNQSVGYYKIALKICTPK